MKLFGALLVLVMGIIISIVAAWFSVTGMVALFNASAIGVMAMMISLEAGKLVASGWLKVNWANPNVNFLHRAYLLGAVIVLCLITSIGIYGYLAAGHLEQAAPRADIAVQSQPLELQLQQKNDENARLTQRLNQIDQNIGVFLKNDKATQGLSASKSLQRERDQIQKKIDENNVAINALHEKLGPLKMQSNAVEAKLGPVKYVAALFGWEDEESAVRLVILILMLAFDPLAVVLLLSAMTSLREWDDERKGPKPDGGDLLDPEALHLFGLELDEDEEVRVEDVEPENKEPVIVGYDTVGFDAPVTTEGSKFSPDYSFKLTAAPPLSTYKGYQGLFDWYNDAKRETEKQQEPTEPTFKVLALSDDFAPREPSGELFPEDRSDWSLADEPQQDFEAEDIMGPDPQEALLDELEQSMKKLEDERNNLLEKLADRELDVATLQADYQAALAAQDEMKARASELDEANRDLQKELDQTTVDRDELISILERNPGILDEIEQIVEEDVVEEMSDREKLLDLLEKNPSIINDMAGIIAAQITKGPSEPGWLDR